MQYTLHTSDALTDIEPHAWNDLAGHNPLLSHAFLTALETSGSVGDGTGWNPHHLLVYDGNHLVGAMPLYIKQHSYGEYVFDWAWADAYARHGIAYYPKLLSAIPFTPITSPRLLTAQPEVEALMINALTKMMISQQLSSVHVLFPDGESAKAFDHAGWLRRSGVQFRWENERFTDFDAFLATLSHDKRKKIRQERKKINAAGITCRHIKGVDVTNAEWDFFYACYNNTYVEHHATPYLTPAFFKQIGYAMPDNILLVIAYFDHQPIAAALNIYDNTTLYGRYWGALHYWPNLHFELCYYQAQEFCIAENIRYFEGGAQGEHKLARGFKPRPTCSYHRIVHPEFAMAIKDYVNRESRGIGAYTDELEERVPFKKTGAP